MKTLNRLIVFMVMCLCVACGKKTDKELETDYLTPVVNDLHVKDNIKWVVILPGLGCHGCIQEGEFFMKENAQNKDIYFVLTSIESLKILQNKIGLKVTEMTNVYLDKANTIKIPTINNIYPCIIEVSNGKLKDHVFQSPHDGPAFEKLRSLIKASS